MSKHTNTVPYTNDRLSGRTHPGLIEMRDDFRGPSRGPNGIRFLPLGVMPNRANRRARGQRLPVDVGTRRNPLSRWLRRRVTRAVSE